MLSSPPPCEAGFICKQTDGVVNGNVNASCTEVQNNVTQQFGNILDGIYCPENEHRIRNCPAGYYCEDPSEEPKLCPKGKYCPMKTKVPEFKCDSCKGGEKEFSMHKPAFFGLLVVTVFLPLIYIIYKMMRKRIQDEKGDEERWNKIQSNDEKDKTNQKEREAQLERLKPILEMIQDRIGKSRTFLHLTKRGKVVNFDIDGLFDAIDFNKNEFISYSELDNAMSLGGDQLAIFIRLMNEAGGVEPDSSNVSRKVFTENFFNTIDAVGNLTPSEQDAEKLFEKMLEKENSVVQSVLLNDKLPLTLLNKYLAMFLSDKQILMMIRIMKSRLLSSTNRADHAGSRVISDGSGGISDEEAPASNHNEIEVVDSGTSVKKSMKKSASFVSKVFSSPPSYTEDYISKAEFVSLYPPAMKSVLSGDEKQIEPFDIQFSDLSLTVKTNGKDLPVVNQVSGRIQTKAMTALMGGSGAGKTSLLNALCGRAHYGTVSGNIMINGKDAKIEDQLDVIGFVPQDDIVYAELTVLENLMFAGKFKLPRETSFVTIKHLAEDVIADLGLTRVTNSIVGDVNRRGVSGGEKKRVNIGLELMAKPSILFLDEPTSGLDASSAVVVMTSLHRLVKNQGMTVCSVIHQPRKQIFEMFDSLVLLGVGGRTVYHGSVSEVQSYFKERGYEVPAGESLADWLLDVSAGRVSSESSELQPMASMVALSEDNFEAVNRSRLYKIWTDHFDSLSIEQRVQYNPPEPFPLPSKRVKPDSITQTWSQFARCLILFKRNFSAKLQETLIIVLGATAVTLLDGPLALTKDKDPNIPNEYFVLTTVHKDSTLFEESFPLLFGHALRGSATVLNYASKISVVVCVLVALSTTKALTDKRVEFFREASSGYCVNAYFLAINLFSILEVSVKMLLTGIFCYVLRNTAANGIAAIVQFLLLGWMSSSWGMLWPTFVPLETVPLVTAFHQIFCGLLLSGGSDPVTYEDIYESRFVGFISTLLSPPRFFMESLTVNEYKATPEQHGFTTDLGGDYTNSFAYRGLAGNDLQSAIEESKSGWYWGVFPSICLGLAIRFLALILLISCHRSKQLKKSIREEMKHDVKARITFIVYLCCFIIFFLTGMSIAVLMH